VNRVFVRNQIIRFLEEDLGRGDITTEALYPERNIRAVIISKGEGVLAGTPFVRELFSLLGEVELRVLKGEGERFRAGDVIMELEGRAESILMGERLSLNLLQSLSGIATLTAEFVKALDGTGVRILDTRKTTPGYRYFEKYAVRIGGGTNHRFALYDMILIKDNHKRVAGGLRKAVELVKKRISPAYKIEVEIEDLSELELALDAGVDMVLLDNFTPEEVRTAVEIVRGRIPVEVSGNITIENVREYAVKGVNFISSGSIVYRASWIDLSLRVL